MRKFIFLVEAALIQAYEVEESKLSVNFHVNSYKGRKGYPLNTGWETQFPSWLSEEEYIMEDETLQCCIICNQNIIIAQSNMSDFLRVMMDTDYHFLEGEENIWKQETLEKFAKQELIQNAEHEDIQMNGNILTVGTETYVLCGIQENLTIIPKPEPVIENQGLDEEIEETSEKTQSMVVSLKAVQEKESAENGIIEQKAEEESAGKDIFNMVTDDELKLEKATGQDVKNYLNKITKDQCNTIDQSV